jgi:hypothetical protein
MSLFQVRKGVEAILQHLQIPSPHVASALATCSQCLGKLSNPHVASASALWQSKGKLTVGSLQEQPSNQIHHQADVKHERSRVSDIPLFDSAAEARANRIPWFFLVVILQASIANALSAPVRRSFRSVLSRLRRVPEHRQSLLPWLPSRRDAASTRRNRHRQVSGTSSKERETQMVESGRGK